MHVILRNCIFVAMTGFFFRVFKLLADINSGSIFSLLMPNVLVIACSMFNAEHVNILIDILQ